MKQLLRTMMALAMLLAVSGLRAHVVTTEPAIVQQGTQDIVIIFHADRGNEGLKGVGQSTKVYAHTGVITTASTGTSDWKHAPTWGDNSDKYEMKWISANTWMLTIPSIDTFYGLTAGETVKQLAFVFRTADKSREGKDEGNADILIDVLPNGYQIVLKDDIKGASVKKGDTVKFSLYATAESTLELSVDGTVIGTSSNAKALEASYRFDEPGTYTVTANSKTTDGTATRTTTRKITCLNQATAKTYPGGVPQMGARIQDDGSVIFCLAAPGKENVSIVGSWNDYSVGAEGQMYYQDYQGYRYFWLPVLGLKDNTDYIYYYIIDGTKKVGDPYAHLVLDPYNDRFINSSVFPDMPVYPTAHVQNVPLAVFNKQMDAYDWEIDEFKGVDKSDLIIYELLIRDFTGTEGAARGNGTIKGVLEKLDYLKDLGVNAVELMPIMEFNGNNSWGYNTNFYMAPDKAYGTPDEYKLLVDECHKRGLAVILDIVFNQSDGLHPWYQMYDIKSNPFYNGSAPHSYSVLNDWNQDNPVVQRQWHDALTYWMTAYKVDGFRFDLVKGLGSNSSYNNTYNASNNTFGPPSEANTNAYNASRVAEMRSLHEVMRKVNENAYFINENLAGSKEENEMAVDGELNWANVNDAACQFAMGFNSNASLNRFYARYDSRTWGSTVSYAESHDEERMAYKQATWGAAGVKGNAEVSSRRLGSVAAQMLMAPGAHMIWQFQELGADQTTKNSGGNNTSPKKVIWSYLDTPAGAALHDSYRSLCAIRANNPELFKETAQISLNFASWDKGRTLSLVHESKRLVMAVNPMVDKEATIAVDMPGNVADYKIMSASAGVPVSINSGTITLAPGAYCVLGTNSVLGGVDTPAADAEGRVVVAGGYGEINVYGDYNDVAVYTVSGVRTGVDGLSAGIYVVIVDGVAYKVAVR